VQLGKQDLRRARAWAPELENVLAQLDELEDRGKLAKDLRGVSRCAIRLVWAAHWQRANDDHHRELWPYVTRGGKDGKLVEDCYGMSPSEVFRCLRVLELLELARRRKAFGVLPDGGRAGRNQVVRRPMLPARATHLRVVGAQVLPSCTPAQETSEPLHVRESTPRPTPAREGALRTPSASTAREQVPEPPEIDVARRYAARWWPTRGGWACRGPVLREIRQRLAEDFTVAQLVAASTQGLERHKRGRTNVPAELRDPHAIFRSPALLDELLELANDRSDEPIVGAVFGGTESPRATAEERAATLAKPSFRSPFSAQRPQGFERERKPVARTA
jgi:hypothetical protein